MEVDSIYLNNDKFQKNYIDKTVTTKPGANCVTGDIIARGWSPEFMNSIRNYGQVSISGTVASQVVIDHVLYVGIYNSASGFIWFDARDLKN